MSNKIGEEDIEFYKERIDHNTAIKALILTMARLDMHFAYCRTTIDYCNRVMNMPGEAGRAAADQQKFFAFQRLFKELVK